MNRVSGSHTLHTKEYYAMKLRTVCILLYLIILSLSPVVAKGSQETNVEAPHRAMVEVTHDLGTSSVPANPSRVLVFDLGALDILHQADIDIIGLGKGATMPSHLASYDNPSSYPVVGSLHEPDFEKVYDLEPELILIGGRAATAYDELSKIAPTVLITLPGADYLGTLEQNVEIISTMFPDKAEMLKQAMQELVDTSLEIQQQVQEAGHTALFLMVNAGNLSVFGPGSRFSLIHDTFGFLPADDTINSSTHGQSSSFEYLLQQNPDYLFVLDRGAATTAGAQGSVAQALLDNALVKQMDAYKHHRIVYVDPVSWYVASGGIEATRIMIRDIEEALSQ